MLLKKKECALHILTPAAALATSALYAAVCILPEDFYYIGNEISYVFKSNIRETWRVILVSKADIFLSESLRILAERLSQSEICLCGSQISD